MSDLELSTEDVGHKGLISLLKKNNLDVKLSEVDDIKIEEKNGTSTIKIYMTKKKVRK